MFENLRLQHWPTEVPELQPAVKSLFDLLCTLGDRVLCAMAIGLGLVSVILSKILTIESIKDDHHISSDGTSIMNLSLAGWRHYLLFSRAKGIVMTCPRLFFIHITGS